MSNNEKPYIIETKVVHEYKYNPKFGDDRMCKCGHPYYRHFDTYADMDACGCKYCECYHFVEEGTEPQDPNADQKPCETCDQMRPHPTDAGKWEYVHAYEKRRAEMYNLPVPWTRADIIRVVDGRYRDCEIGALIVIPEGETEPIWWPNDAVWRKV